MTISNFFKIFLIIIVFFIGFFNFQAVASEKDSGEYTYVFHLEYAAGNLTIDRSFDFPFDLEAKKYQPTATPNNSYSGKIISVKGEILATVYFFPSALVSGNSGKLPLEAPYFPNAKTALFSDTLGKELLNIDLAPNGPLCNEDGICNSNFGEDSQNCPADCLKASAELEKNIQVEKESGSLILVILGLISGSLAITIGAWIIFRKKNS